MPGTKWKRSLKRPAIYEALRKQGMPKSRAAAISNSMAKKSSRRKRRSK